MQTATIEIPLTLKEKLENQAVLENINFTDYIASILSNFEDIEDYVFLQMSLEAKKEGTIGERASLELMEKLKNA